jgi:hypothetical protein
MTKKTKKVKKVATPKTVKSTPLARDPHEIIQNFQKLLMTADNFGKPNVDTDYKQFWLGLRKNGPDMLGITKAILTELEKSIEVLNATKNMLAQAEQKLEELKIKDGSPGVHGMARK